MDRIKWSIEYWRTVEFSIDALSHWMEIILSKDFTIN